MVQDQAGERVARAGDAVVLTGGGGVSPQTRAAASWNHDCLTPVELYMQARGVRNACLWSGVPEMLYWALVFLVVALVAGLFGFGGLASASAGIAQTLFFVFLILLVISVAMHLMRGRAPPV